MNKNDDVLNGLFQLLDLANNHNITLHALREITTRLSKVITVLDITEEQRVILKLRIASRELLISKNELVAGKYKEDANLSEHTEKVRSIIIDLINLYS